MRGRSGCRFPGGFVFPVHFCFLVVVLIFVIFIVILVVRIVLLVAFSVIFFGVPILVFIFAVILIFVLVVFLLVFGGDAVFGAVPDGFLELAVGGAGAGFATIVVGA